MITIDGAIGGGQVLRTALGLSCLFGTPFRLVNIRKSRPNPGLQEQHLQCVLSVAKLCNAEVKGTYKGSTEICFTPEEVKQTNLDIKISTAGSVGLVLQSLLIVGFKYSLNIKISGGATYGKWAPSIEFIDKIFCWWLRKLGMRIDIKVLRHGFYPKGGAEVEVNISPAKSYSPIVVTQLGKLKAIKIFSVASDTLSKRNVLERMVSSAKSVLSKKFNVKIEEEFQYVDAVCDGCGITICAETENAVVGSSSCGEIGKKAEDVGREAAEMLTEDILTDGIDRFTADQIIPYLKLCSGEVKVSNVTEHVNSNIYVVEKFLQGKIEVENNLIKVSSPVKF